MPKSRLLLPVLLLCVTGFGQAQSIKAEIKPSRSVVGNKESLRIGSVLRNVGSTDETVGVLMCGYDGQWLPDNAVVEMLGPNCLQNGKLEIQLKPGEVYAKPISLWVRLAPDFSGRKDVTFRLGFHSGGFVTRIDPGVRLIWSNAVTVTVTGTESRAPRPPR